MSDVRLIDASTLKNLLIEVLERIKENPTMKIDEMHIIAGCHMLCEMIDDAPTIDAVPVVRCRECKKRTWDWHCPFAHLGWVEDDGFCHWGEK